VVFESLVRVNGGLVVVVVAASGEMTPRRASTLAPFRRFV
jgi:hypothetical protein